MNAIKAAVYARLVNDTGATGVATLVGSNGQIPGGGPKISQQRSELRVDDLPWVTLAMPSGGGMPVRIPMHDEILQIDVWGNDPDLNDRIAERITALMRMTGTNGPLVIASGALRVDSLTKTLETELYEVDLNVHHKVLQFRVISFEQ